MPKTCLKSVNDHASFVCKLSISFFIFISLLLSFGTTYSQNDFSNRMKYMDVLPPSPAAAAISNFNRPDIGMVSGTAKFNVPITSIDLPGLSIPIGINYSSNGVKVDEIAGRVGMSWQLETGGVITRTVMGSGADERTRHYAPPANTSSTSREFYKYLYNVSATAGNDPQPDIFNYSICGLSGQFVLNADDVPVCLPKTNVTVKMEWWDTEHGFIVTDPNGNEFYFGGPGYVEKTRKEQTCGRPFGFAETTAFYLKKIKLYNLEEVTFQYLSRSYQYDLGVSETMNYASPEQNNAQATYPYEAYPCAKLPNRYSCVNMLNVIETKYLTSIQSRTKSISFEYNTRLDYGDMLLDKIIVNTKGVTENEVYDLNYQHYNTSLLPSTGSIGNLGHRYFLTSIDKITGGTTPVTLNLYRFRYNNPQGLPMRLSYAQDHWGYFNGKSNPSFIPPPPNPELAKQFPSAKANREVDTVKSQFGMLVRIDYPTRGYDSIIYEPNKHYSTKTIYPTEIDGVNYGPLYGTGHPMIEKSYGTFTLSFDQKVSVWVRSSKMNNGTPDPIHDSGAIKIVKISGTGSGGFLGTGTVEGSNQTDMPLKAGTYQVYLQASGYNTKTEGGVTYIPGPLQYVSKDWPVGGVRVKSIRSYSYDGTPAGKKRFWYATRDNLYRSSASDGHYFDYSKYISYDYYVTRWDGNTPNICVSRNCQYNTLFSTSQTSLFAGNGNSVNYTTVLESPTDDLSMGFIEHKFYISPDRQPSVLLGNSVLQGAMSNFTIYNNGVERETTHFKVENGLHKPVKRTRYVYDFRPELYQYFTGCLINRFYDEVCAEGAPTDPAWDYEMAKFEASRYTIESPWMVLDSVIEENYDNAKILRSFKKYSHEDLVSLQPTQITSVNSQGQQEVIRNYYSSMRASIPGITPVQSNYLGLLQADNKLSDVVYQDVTKDGKFINAYRVNYDMFAPNNLVYPKEVQVSYAANTVAKSFSMSQYDGVGNILERTSEDGIKSALIWDYDNRFVTAQITGASFGDVAATSFEGNGYGNWVLSSGNVIADATAPTGQKVLSLGQLYKSGLNPDLTYIVSFSYKTGASVNVSGGTSNTLQNTVSGMNGWTSAEWLVSGASNISVSGTGSIDELRLYPNGAQIVTLTYDPQKGTTSSTDQNGKTTHYQYDGLSRLINVRDQDRYLLSTYRYNYRTLESQ